MKRLMIVLLLAGCATEEDRERRRQAQQVIETACDNGDVQACVAIQQQNDAQRRAAAQALGQLGRDLQAQSQQNRIRTTNCRPGFGGSVRCTSY